MFDSYDKKYLASRLFVLLVVVGAMYLTEGVGFALVVPLVVVSLLKKDNENLLFYLILTGTLVVGNQNLMPKTVVFFVLQRGIMFILAVLLSIRVFGGRNSPAIKPLLTLSAYLVFMVFSSAAGWCPMVSYLKLALFGSCFFAYYAVSSNIVLSRRTDIRKVRSILLVFACFYIFGSVALIPFPTISQLQGEDYMELVLSGRQVVSLFIGMTNQSQCLGPVVAALSCLLVGDLLFGIKKADKLYTALLLCAPILIYKTSSRTALGTFAFGIVSILFLFMRTRGVNIRWRSRVLLSFLALGVTLGSLLVASSGARQGALNYLIKWGGDEVRAADLTFENIYATRQGKMDAALYNFKKSPMIGNGFQVSEEMIGLSRSGLRGILSAPIEKGVWVTAVLEEGGAIGFGLFCLFVVVSITGMLRSKAYIGAAILMTFLISNLGEFSFFSMSYIGGFMWAMVFLGLILDTLRNRANADLVRFQQWY